MKNRVLFKGASCFPLSPRSNKNEQYQNVNIISKQDQLYLTFKVLGKQTDEDLSFLSNDHMVDYAKRLDKK